MWFALRQRVLSWLSVEGRSEMGVRSEEFRTSEPVLAEPQSQHMEHVGEGNVQVGQNNGSVRFVNLSQERNITHIHVYGDSEPQPIETKPSLTTPEQREVLALIRQLHGKRKESVFVFIKREFGTEMVMDLQPSQVLRVRRYVEAINQRIKAQRGSGNDQRNSCR